MLAKSPDRLLEYLGAIARLAPLIAEHRETFDQERRLPDTVFQALADAGLFRLWLPEALGGPELPPSEFMMVVEAVSALDGSVGWLVGNGAGMSRIGGYLPEAVARDLFADPRAYVVSATGAIGAAQRTDGGYRITGRWPFGSGAHHATRFMGLASLKGPDGGDEPLRCFYFDRGDVLVHDTWKVSGLRATGSCDFEVRDLFVPESHTHLFMGHKATQAGGCLSVASSLRVCMDRLRRPTRDCTWGDGRLCRTRDPQDARGNERAALRQGNRPGWLRPG